MANSMTFGKKLKMLRVGKGLTQDEMASELGISRRAYIPYEQDKTKPRNEATYRKMAETLDCDVHELTDLVDTSSPKNDIVNYGVIGAALAAVGLFVPFVGMAGVPFIAASAAALVASAEKGAERKTNQTNTSLEYNNDLLLQYTNRQKKFQATAKGVLYSDLSQKHIEFRPGNPSDLEDHGGKPDDYITVLNNSIHSWWFSFWAKDPELDKHVIISPEERAGVMISRYATAAFDPHRKISIVVDDNELFENLIAYRNHNCFHGNMTAILVDVENVMIVKEEAIAELDTPSALEKAEITTES